MLLKWFDSPAADARRCPQLRTVVATFACRFKRTLFVLLTLVVTGPVMDVRAESESACEPDCIAVGEWEFGIELGYSHIPNPIAGGDDLRLPMLFRFSFYADKFFLETGTFGYTLWETPTQRVNLIATPNLDYFYFAESGSAKAVLTRPFQPFIPIDEYWGPEEPLNERKLTYLGGIEYSAFSGPWQWQVKAGSDISVGHDGYEIWVSGKHTWQSGRVSLYTSVGAVYRDAKLANYYYGVSEADTWQFWYHYAPGASWSPYASFNASYELTESVSLLLLTAVQKPDESIRISPLVVEDWFTATFIGIDYAF